MQTSVHSAARKKFPSTADEDLTCAWVKEDVLYVWECGIGIQLSDMSRCPAKNTFLRIFTVCILFVSHTQTPRQFVCNNFGKCGPISTVLSLLHSEKNCGRSCCIIRHLASNLLLHYLAKFECSTVQLYSKVIHFKIVQNRLFALNVRDVMFSIICRSH